MIFPEGGRRLALLAGLIAALIWSTSFLVISGWLAHVGPLTIAGLWNATYGDVVTRPLFSYTD